MFTNFQRILLDVLTSPALDSGDLEQARSTLVVAAASGLGIGRAGIWLWRDDNQAIECVTLADNRHQTADQQPLLTRETFPAYFEALDTERVIAAHDATSHPATLEFKEGYLLPNNITSILDLPLRYRGKVVGILCCEHIGPQRFWTEPQIQFASSLADLYGRAQSAARSHQYQQQLELAKAELEQTVQRRTQELHDKIQLLKDTQDQLVESEKMAALGNLVAGVAHEINNPLGVAITAVTSHQASMVSMQQKFEQGTLSRRAMEAFFGLGNEAIDAVLRNLDRAATLVQNFKKTAVDQSVFERETINLCDYLDTTLSNFKPLFKRHQVEIDLDCDEKIEITTFPGAFAQIITNLVVNACLHGFESNNNNQINLKVVVGDSNVTIWVKDNGQGMTADILKKATQPFFTTKRSEGGSGLGLSIVYNLVNQKLKGSMQLESEPQKGTTVKLCLPLDVGE